MTRTPPRRITHLLQAWPPHLPTSEPPNVVVHVRGAERLQREIDELKQHGLKVCVVPVGVSNDEEWWA